MLRFQANHTEFDVIGRLNPFSSSTSCSLQDGPDPYQQWYAPVRSTLLLLSKLYRCVDTKIFAGLAQDAIAACSASVQSAAKLVGKNSGVLDSQLFIIQHLLFLREQIAPFEVDFAVTDVDLDFTHMRDHIRRIMTGGVNGTGAFGDSGTGWKSYLNQQEHAHGTKPSGSI
jgi:hypothetical protein